MCNKILHAAEIAALHKLSIDAFRKDCADINEMKLPDFVSIWLEVLTDHYDLESTTEALVYAVFVAEFVREYSWSSIVFPGKPDERLVGDRGPA